MTSNPLIYVAQIKQGNNVLIHVEGLIQYDGDLERLISNELFDQYRKQYPNQSLFDRQPPPQVFAFEKP